MLKVKLIFASLVFFSLIVSASAHSHHHSSVVQSLGKGLAHMLDSGSRPRQWCGWYMAQKLGITGSHARRLWLAHNWAYEGVRTFPHVGAVVVWAHHVGQIVGQAANGLWLVNSGNDGRAVRTRPLSIAGAIAIRDVGQGSFWSSLGMTNEY